MGQPFPVHAVDGAPVMAVRVEQVEDLPDGLAALGLHGGPRPVVVLIGGAGGLDPADEDTSVGCSTVVQCRSLSGSKRSWWTAAPAPG